MTRPSDVRPEESDRILRDEEGKPAIYLPKPDIGHPIAQLLTDVPNLTINVSAASDEELAELAARICAVQAGSVWPRESIECRDSMYGEPLWLTPNGLDRITAISRAFAKIVDVTATQHPSASRIATPGGFRRNR